MPLIDFKTDLKSLRYGSDKPNGGSSVKDSIDRLERQVEEIYRILLARNKS